MKDDRLTSPRRVLQQVVHTAQDALKSHVHTLCNLNRFYTRPE